MNLNNDKENITEEIKQTDNKSLSAVDLRVRGKIKKHSDNFIGDKSYGFFVQYAKSLLVYTHYYQTSAEEIVSEAYLRAAKKNNYNVEDFLGYIKQSVKTVGQLWQTTSILQISGEKKCTQCKETKPIDDFGKYLQFGKLWRRSSWCKKCNRIKVKRWNKDNKEKYYQRLNKWKSNGRKHYDLWYVKELLAKKYSRSWLNSNPEFVKRERDKIILRKAINFSP